MTKDSFQLDAEVRDIVGKKVKQLRRAGYVPAVVYGPNFENVNIAIDAKTLRHVLLQAGGTQLIDLNIGGDAVPTLARVVQRDPLRGEILHVDFYRVALDRPIRADVPLNFAGESPIVARGEGILHTFATSLSIEALPADLPSHLDVDLTYLTEVGQHITAADLPLPRRLKLITDENELLVKIDLPIAEPVEEETLLVEEESAEPELVRKGKGEEEEEEG